MSLQTFFILLNDYELNGVGSGVYLNAVTGLGNLDIRISGDLYSGRDGGFVSTQFLDQRGISIQGTIFADDSATAENKRREVIAAVSGLDVEMVIRTFAGSEYTIQTKLVKIDGLEFNGNKFSYQFRIELLAPDPYIYETTDGDELSAAIAISEGGGYTMDYNTDEGYVLPVEWEASEQPVTITNNGNATFTPVIYLYGELSNPVITNQTTGQSMSLTLTSSTGDVIKIDNKNRTITLNGGNILALMGSSSQWIEIQPGDNIFVLTTDTQADTGSGLIEWFNTYIGI